MLRHGGQSWPQPWAYDREGRHRQGNHIDWHGHWNATKKTYHGFYCVNTEGVKPSHTKYRIPGVSNEIIVGSEDGLLVIGKSENDEHQVLTTVFENGKLITEYTFDEIRERATSKYPFNTRP